jgi:glucan biosynthesis protein C
MSTFAVPGPSSGHIFSTIRLAACPPTDANKTAMAGVDSKDLPIESLRGLAIVLMVLGHVVGDTNSRGLHVGDDSAYRYLYFLTDYLRMPLFTVISGFVYAMRPVRFSMAAGFLKGKARRLLLPLTTVATLQFVVQHLAPGVNAAGPWSEMWRIYVYSYDQFWFVQALFSVFLTIIFLDGAGFLATPLRWAVCLATTMLASNYLPKTDLFSLWGYLYLLPYFILGCGLHRFADTVERRWVFTIASAPLLAGHLIQQAAWFGGFHNALTPYGWVGLSVGLGGTTLLFCLGISSRLLAILGSYAFSIYLFHVFATAGSRIVVSRLGLETTPPLILIGLASGLGLPMALDRLLKQSRLLRTAFLGLR